MLTYCELDLQEQISMKFQTAIFRQNKSDVKCRNTLGCLGGESTKIVAKLITFEM